VSLFSRQVILQLGTEGNTGKSFRDIRVSFRVKMSRSSTPNTAAIQAWNLNAATVALLQQPRSVARLLVGYDTPQLIFQGNPVANGVTLERQGPDRVLTIEAQDGGRVYQEARVSISFATETTLRQVYDEVSRQMGLPAGTIRISEDVVFSQGLSLSGTARDVMDRIARSTGSDWFVRDGVLQLVGTSEDTGEPAVVFSTTTGNLVGAPSRKDDGVEVKALIAPALRPGKKFVVESADISGTYIAGDVEFEGDSGWAQPFYVKTVGKAA
jgi:hypothetical protein